MRVQLIGWIAGFVLLSGSPVLAQSVSTPIITFPISGQVVQGQVAITGTTDIPNFGSAEVDFSYLSEKSNTRFPIQIMNEIINNDVLATWDTTTVSDGDYVILLRVNLADGTNQEVSTPVKIRNYSALPSPTPTSLPTEPAIQIPTPFLIVPSITPTSAPLPTPTLLPINPTVTNTNDIYSGFVRGGLFVVLIFVLFGIVTRIRRS